MSRAVSMVALILGLGVALMVATTALTLRMTPPALVGGRETIRFPETNRCGIVVQRRDSRGAIDVTLRTGTIVRSGGDFDASSGAAEALVPAWARDRLVPWNWNGQWQMGQRSVRHLVVRGWPWPAFYAVLEARSESPEGPGGWIVLEGVQRSSAAASPWAPEFPRLWTTAPIWPAAIANLAVHSAIAAAFITVIWFAARWCMRCSRIRTGRCPQCGYLRRGDAEGCCPECGRRSS